jgi:hypothetical protein
MAPEKRPEKRGREEPPTREANPGRGAARETATREQPDDAREEEGWSQPESSAQKTPPEP